MKRSTILILMLALPGCGVELLTTTAIEGKLQADQMKAMKGQITRASDTTAKINLQRAIDTYAAEKGRYPATLAELAPGYLPSVPNRPDGTPYGYDAVAGKVLDGPAAPPPVSAGPTPGDMQKMNQIREAVNSYGRAVGFYPPSLAALVPTYLASVPKTDSGQDFIFYPQNGALYHPAQLMQQPQAPVAAQPPMPQQPRVNAGMGGAGPMGEAMTGIGIQNQLNSNSNAGSNTAGSYGREKIGGIAGQHNQQQEQVMNNLGL